MAESIEAKAQAQHATNEPYFQPDKTYDHRFYTSPWWNYILIIFVYLLIYATGCAIFAAFFYFGIHNAKWMGVVNLLIYGFTLFFLAWMIWAGSKANKLKREHDFWQDQIALRRAKIQEKKTKELQDAEYEARIRKADKQAAQIQYQSNFSIQSDAQH